MKSERLIFPRTPPTFSDESKIKENTKKAKKNIKKLIRPLKDSEIFLEFFKFLKEIKNCTCFFIIIARKPLKSKTMIKIEKEIKMLIKLMDLIND